MGATLSIKRIPHRERRIHAQSLSHPPLVGGDSNDTEAAISRRLPHDGSPLHVAIGNWHNLGAPLCYTPT